MGALPMYVWALVLVGLIGTTADHLRDAVPRRHYRRLWSRHRHSGGWCDSGPSGALGCWRASCWPRPIFTGSSRRGPCRWLPVGLIGALAVALLLSRIPVVSRIVAQPDAPVAVDGATDLSGGGRDLPGCAGAGPVAGRVRFTCRARRYGDRGRGRVRRAQPSARRRRPHARCGLQRPWPCRSRRRARYWFRRSACSCSAAGSYRRRPRRSRCFRLP